MAFRGDGSQNEFMTQFSTENPLVTSIIIKTEPAIPSLTED